MDKKVLIQKKDFKSLAWKSAAQKKGYGQLLPVEGHTISLGFTFLWHILTGKKPDGIIFRYLNDSPFLLKTVIQALIEFFTVISANILNTKIGWLCHNIDKETHEHYPLITKIRRKVLLRFADKIFVTDVSLKGYCQQFLGVEEDKILVVTFGFSKCKQVDSIETKDKIHKLIQWYKNFHNQGNGRKKMVGLWIGSPADKKLIGLRKLRLIVEKGCRKNLDVGFIVVGNLKKWLLNRDPELYKWLHSNENCKFWDNELIIDNKYWNDLCDFNWEVYTDYSIPYTVFNAVSVSLPVISLEKSFLGEFVEINKVGAQVNQELTNIHHIYNLVMNDHVSDSKIDFFKHRSWEIGAANLFKLFD